MGTLGPGLYSNDLSADVRNDFREVVRAPWDAERLVAHLASRHPAATDPDDEEHTDFWLVVADQLWRYGMAHAQTIERVREIVRSGRDLDAKRALGMSSADVRKRGRQIDELLSRVQTNNPHAAARNVPKRPEPFLLPEGGCLTWPTTQGRARNPYVGTRQSAAYDALYGWAPDGWGALVVLACFHRYEVLARYVGGVLELATSHRPAVEDYGRAKIRVEDPGSGRGRLVASFFAPKAHLANMKVETVGTVEVDGHAIRRDLPPFTSMIDTNLGDLVSAWSNQQLAAAIALAPWLR